MFPTLAQESLLQLMYSKSQPVFSILGPLPVASSLVPLHQIMASTIKLALCVMEVTLPFNFIKLALDLSNLVLLRVHLMNYTANCVITIINNKSVESSPRSEAKFKQVKCGKKATSARGKCILVTSQASK